MTALTSISSVQIFYGSIKTGFKTKLQQAMGNQV